MTYSDKHNIVTFYLQVTPKTITLEEGQSAVVKITTTVPILCKEECKVRIYVRQLGGETVVLKGCETVFKNGDLQENEIEIKAHSNFKKDTNKVDKMFINFFTSWNPDAIDWQNYQTDQNVQV